MKESMSPLPNVEEEGRAERTTTDEEEARYAEWLAQHPETPTPEIKRECGPEISELEALFAAFESAHSLEALHAIVDLTPEDALKHPVRQPAKEALEPIVAKLRVIKEETDATEDQYAALRAAYKRLSRAVGIINNNRVDHSR